MLSDQILSFVSGSASDMIRYGGLALVLLLVFLETGLLFGVFIPGGGSLLFTAGLLADTPLLPLPVYVLIPAVIITATLGDLLGYTIGRKMGPYFEHRQDTWYFKHHHLDKARKFYEQHGWSAIILGRFLPFIRTFNPLLSGILHIPMRRFIVLCFCGTTIWATALMGSSYLAGRQFPALRQNGYLLVITVIIISLVPLAFQFIKSAFRKYRAGQQL